MAIDEKMGWRAKVRRFHCMTKIKEAQTGQGHEM